MALTTQPKNLSTTESILDQLRNDINNFVYDEQFITEAAISTRFQVSRTPAREALNTLCQYRSILECGSVEYAIRFASDSDLEKISELANRTLDPKDPDFNNQYHELNLTFHLSIARLTRNTYLISALENVFNRLRRDLLIDGRSNLENSLDMHIQLAAAMKRRDLEQAHRITADQIDFVEKRLYLH